MVSFELEGKEAKEPTAPVKRYRVVTSSLIVEQTVYTRGDIISSDDIGMDLRYYTGLKLIELIDENPRKKKNFFQKLFSR